MSEHLDKAKNAVTAAADLDVDLSCETLPRIYLRLVDLALVQANIAQAEALERIADTLEEERK